MADNELKVVEEPEEKQPIGRALTAFIVSFFAVIFSVTGVLSVPGMVMGIISLAFANNSVSVTRKPFVAFRRVARPMSIVAIVLGAVISALITIGLIVWGIIALVNHVNNPSQIGLF